MRVCQCIPMILGLAVLAGCSKTAPQEAPPSPAAAAKQEAPVKAEPASTPDPIKKHAEGEGHHHTAPHGGTLISLGDHTGHLELALDSAAGALTLYALDGEAENPVRLNSIGFQAVISIDGKPDVSVAFKPVANVLTGETGTSTSQYTAQADELKGVTAFKGSIPELSFRGMELADISFTYPGGNE